MATKAIVEIFLDEMNDGWWYISVEEEGGEKIGYNFLSRELAEKAYNLAKRIHDIDQIVVRTKAVAQ